MDEFSELIEHLTDNARSSLVRADFWSQITESDYIGTEHLLLGILAQETAVGTGFLNHEGITLEKVQSKLTLSDVKPLASHPLVKVLSETAKVTLHMGWSIAKDFNSSHLGTEHILMAILSQKRSKAVALLQELDIDVDDLNHKLRSYFSDQLVTRIKNRPKAPSETIRSQSRTKRSSMLSIFGTNLTTMAAAGKLDPVIGRSAQIERLATILSRRNKSNPVLIGEPGVGKSAIVEGLAQKIANAEVPSNLLEAQIIQIDLPGVVAGTKFRGEFEERFKKIIDELARDKNLIGFIDELHLLTGAGSSEGSIDAANILKPALARGKIRLIGATTFDEYRKYIEKDSALDRRFQTVDVPEPTVEQTIAIIKGSRKNYQTHHRVQISDDIIASAVWMSDKYVSDRYFPDKAIDLIDEAAAYKRVRQDKVPTMIREDIYKINRLNVKINEAIDSQDYDLAAELKVELDTLNRSRNKVKKSKKSALIELSVDDLAQVVALRTGIPISKIKKSEQNTVLKLETNLNRLVIGQKAAVKTVSRAIRRSRSGISSPSRPIGSFIFLGPSGVGKTELAKVIAEEVFGGSDALIKIDMSEFSERHSLSRLLGAPAGYVGYEDGGKLTDAVRRRPYRVVLFDEIEKAHPEIFNILLQLLEDGTLTDAKGRVVNFANTVIILTSNLGSETISKKEGFGFNETANKNNESVAQHALSRFMRPELINRFDDIVVFNELNRIDMGKIFDSLITKLQTRLAQAGFSLKITSKVKAYIIKLALKDNQGARPLRRLIDDKIEYELSEAILLNQAGKGDLLLVDLDQQKITVKVKQPVEVARKF